jgi:hypothetical protein
MDTNPDGPVRDAGSAPIHDLLFWRAELDDAITACCTALATKQVTVSAAAASEAITKAAEAVYAAASDEKKNAAWRVRQARKRCEIAKKNYLVLLAKANTDGPLASPSGESTPCASGRNGMAAAQSHSDAEDEITGLDEEEFQGVSMDLGSSEEHEDDPMEVA